MVTRDLQPDIRRTEFPPCNKTISPPIMKSIIFSWWLFLAALVAASISPFDSPDFCLQIITPTCNTTFSYIDEVNDRIRPLVLKLVTSPFFAFSSWTWTNSVSSGTRNTSVPPETVPLTSFPQSSTTGPMCPPSSFLRSLERFTAARKPQTGLRLARILTTATSTMITTVFS